MFSDEEGWKNIFGSNNNITWIYIRLCSDYKMHIDEDKVYAVRSHGDSLYLPYKIYNNKLKNKLIQ